MIQSALALATGSTGDLVTIWLNPKAAWAGVFHFIIFCIDIRACPWMDSSGQGPHRVLHFPFQEWTLLSGP